MIIDIQSKTVENFYSNFSKKIVACNKYYGVDRIKHWGKCVGSINQNTFWIVKVGTPLVFLPCRYFCGNVSFDGEEPFIQGRFHINKVYLAFMAIWYFLVAGKVLFIDIGVSTLPVKAKVLVSVCIFLLLFFLSLNK